MAYYNSVQCLVCRPLKARVFRIHKQQNLKITVYCIQHGQRLCSRCLGDSDSEFQRKGRRAFTEIYHPLTHSAGVAPLLWKTDHALPHSATGSTWPIHLKTRQAPKKKKQREKQQKTNKTPQTKWYHKMEDSSGRWANQRVWTLI